MSVTSVIATGDWVTSDINARVEITAMNVVKPHIHHITRESMTDSAMGIIR